MDTDDIRLSLPFDHHERYAVTAEGVRLLYRDPRGLEALDVGGHLSSLKLFLPEIVLTIAEPKDPPAFAHRPRIPYEFDRYVHALGGSLPFVDGSFDLVTAHDTLEHVPEDARPDFVRDLLRVARRFVVVNGPFYDVRTLDAEERVARFWRDGLGWADHALQEHFERGLPDPGKFEALLEEAGTSWASVPNGNLQRWVLMMALEGFAQVLPEHERLHEVVDRAFNAVVAPEDLGGACYRTAYFVAKAPEDREALAPVADAFSERVRRADPIPDRRFIEMIVSALEENARSVRDRITQIDGLRDALSRSDADMAERERRVIDLHREIRDKNRQLGEKNEELDWVRESSERERRELEEELERIRSSTGYRVFRGVARRLRRWFPPGTLRGRFVGSLRRLASALVRPRSRQRSEAEEPEVASTARDSEGKRTSWEPPTETSESYLAWIDRYEPKDADLEGERAAGRVLPSQPLISMVMPTWNPPVGLLREAVDSVRAQSYERWELCIADGGSNDEARLALKELAALDERIGIRFLDQNLGISGNTNQAIAMARGDYVAFLDQTDILAPSALYRVAVILNRDPGIDVMYSDWDILSEDGAVRFNPFFTPEWSPDLLLSSNYMSHLSVVRARLLNETGKLRPELDGAQDWDLLFRITERTDRVARIPGILYHWRADPSSAVMSLEAKPLADRAQIRAVGEHLERRGTPARVVRTDEGHLRILWKPEVWPRVSIVIPTRRNRALLERVLAGIEASDYPEVEVLVVETAGRDPEREAWYEELGERFRCRVLWWDRPFNYSAVNNMAAAEASGEVLVFLNDDTEPMSRDWLRGAVGWLGEPGVGIVGGQLIREDERIQHGGVVLGLGGFADHLFRDLDVGAWTFFGSSAWYRNVTAVTGACLAIRREVFGEVGRWDERFELMGSDVELCLRVRRSGRRIVCDPFVRLRHTEAVTREKYIPDHDFLISLWHYQPYLHGGDPHFNPGLSYEHTIPWLRGPGDERPLEVVSRTIGRDLVPREPGDDTKHAQAMAELCQLAPEALDAIESSHRRTKGRREVRTVNWFVPDFENPFYGGIHTIFRFADHFHRHHGVENRFVVIGTGPEGFFRSGLDVTFPEIAGSDIHIAPQGDDARLQPVPSADAAIATLWLTAYPMARWARADRYFSFVQDFEPMFYPAGALYALAEETYRMGLYGIANTPPLKEIYESYGGTATAFTPCVDADVFHTNRPARDPNEPFTVFMYGRPGHPRNCFELAVEALERLKRSMGDRVRIVTAGSWAPLGDDLPWLDRLGLLGYQETADLYRRCDAGLVLSVSKHPTYIPMQLMACGALVVANHNPANGWLLRDGENCLLAEPTAERLHEALEGGLLEREHRAELTSQAIGDIAERHSDWEPEMERVFGFLSDPEG